MANPIQKPKSLQARVLSGSIVLLSGSGFASAINFAYNITVARFLGPKGFGSATAVYTLLTLISALTLSFQIVSAKVVAQEKSPEQKSAAYRGIHRGAWMAGIFIALLLVLSKTAISDFLNLSSPILVVLLAIGAAFYVPLGSRRGYLQGAYGFRRLAANLVLEGAVRLGGSLFIIYLGYGVAGVIAANSAAVTVAYFAITPKLAARITNPIHLSRAIRETKQAMIFFSGQVLINNCDIVLVKHFFFPEAAGLYAAVAMVGRVIFSFSQAVVNSMFPLVAGTHDEERKDLSVIATSLLIVLSIGASIALALRFAPPALWMAFLGSRFQIAGKYDLSYLLALYAITTVIYALSAVIITYEMSYKIANTSWIQLAFSGIVIAGICLFHSSLRQVILVQLVLMITLLFLVALPFLNNAVTDRSNSQLARVFPPVRLIRRISEDEVITEFLKSDFNNPAFEDQHELLPQIVTSPNLDDIAESAQRRALFFKRHLALWNELPARTEWYELESGEMDLAQIRVFPRAQWQNLARGNYSIMEVVEGMRRGESMIDARFLSKIGEIRDQLLLDDTVLGSVILIGTGGTGPLTIIDGNHRLVAASLASPSRAHRLRFLCGLSPEMVECCWYNTNLTNLSRYGLHVMRDLVRIPGTGFARFFRNSWIPETRE